MKLPISLLVLAAFSQGLSVQPLTKRSSEAKSLETKDSPAKSPGDKSSPDKSSVAKQKDSNQTSKRELYEGNFGERNKEVPSKYEVTGPPPKIVYAKEFQETESDQSPTHQIFGMRLPQIIKISDVLSAQGGGSFEAAVAKHLYSPISVYQTRTASPTSFEVPVPAASQSAYSNPKSYKQQKNSDKEQSLQEAPKMENRNNIPLYSVNQPRLHFEAYPQSLDQQLPQEIFQQQQIPIKHMPALFPIYDQLGPFRYPGQVVPSQYLHQNGIFQIVPVRPGFDVGNQDGQRDKIYSKQENQKQLNAERPKPQIDVPVPNQGYHAHPNGAISFASFTHNLPFNKQYEAAPPQQSEAQRQPQQAQLQSEPIPAQLAAQIQSVISSLQSQEQKAQKKQNIQFLPMFHRLMQDLEKYQPVFQQQPQFSQFKSQNQAGPLSALQQHLLYQDPRQLSNPQVIQLQRLPAFKPLPQSLLTSESFLQQTRSPPFSGQPPRPFSFEYQSTSPPQNFDLAGKSAAKQLTPLPPLKPNYSEYVKPLEPHSHTTPVFLPTPLQSFPSSTPQGEPISDQLISSTTIQPSVKDKEDSEIQEETELHTQTSQPLKPEIIHQSEPTVRPPSIQSTTLLPFVTREPHAIYTKYSSTPQPQYQSTIRPQSIKTQPRHDVVIQRQEIQEIFFDPPPQPPRLPHYQAQPANIPPQYERELLQLRSQPHHQLFEQLQPLPYQKELQDIHTQQYLHEARQLRAQQKQGSTQQGVPQQYLVQQHSQPLQFHQLLQSQQPKLQQSQQQQQVLYQPQQHASGQPQQQHVSEQAQQQQESQKQHRLEQTQSLQEAQQQHRSEQAQQQQTEEQSHQQQVSEQIQQQEIAEQAQQQEIAEQAQQQQIAEQAQHEQYQQQQFDSNNQIQISTLKPAEDTEKQTETVEPDSQSTTGNPNEQAEHSSELPSLEEPYLGPVLNPSGLPQIYAHQQQLVAQPEYSPLLGVPPYSDVQYFGKFAESLFGNRHH
ncbi:hypothetical protein PYW07_011994 [Mythimna separata]|uniref:Uncharacterized protein n=1 Tax=Mythimna separata TaxID=271217 RepID=A0AAD7YKU2_MYTSE|nr:hypothetical protein PYW07_011994 [Mythimna separata]